MAESELFSDILCTDHNFSFSVHSTAVVGALQFYSPYTFIYEVSC